MKLLFSLSALMIVLPSFARPPMTVKERLRIVLWHEGLGERAGVKSAKKVEPPRMPEEIEKALRYF